jgi:thiamine kinase-like enzyme
MKPLHETVAELYQTEQEAKPKARTLADVPGTYEAITEDWLTAVLCRETPSAKVTAFRIADRSDGSSNRARIYLTYNAAGNTAGLPATVFCKGSVTLKNRVLLAVSSSARLETAFFQFMRSRLDIETPVPIHAAFDPKTYAYIIVMKDIGATSHFCNDKTVITREHAEKMVNTLAKLHSSFYESPELGGPQIPLLTWSNYFDGVATGFPGFAEACDKGFSRAQEVIPARLFKRQAEIWPLTVASVRRHDRLPKTVVHCDVHLGNWYIAGNGDLGLTDWQCVSIGHWSRDFAYALSTTLNVEDRRAWFDDLLRLYLDKMAGYGAPRISYDEALLDVRQQLMTTLAWWTITLNPSPGMPPMQPPAITYELIKRISAAMDDMDALDAFK